MIYQNMLVVQQADFEKIKSEYDVTILIIAGKPGALNEELFETSYSELEIYRTEGARLSSHSCLPW